MQVSELLESGKTLFKDLSNEFEERMILSVTEFFRIKTIGVAVGFFLFP